MNRKPVTLAGMARVRERLHMMKTVEHPQIIAAIAEARAHGDLSENAEYSAAREQQRLLQRRMTELETALAEAEVVDVGQIDAGGRVVFGATVEMYDLDTEESLRYQIVGDVEADISAGLISFSSPIARALIGREEGETISVVTPGGKKRYEIVAVSYGKETSPR